MPESDFQESWAVLGAISDAIIESNDEAELYFVRYEVSGWPDWYLKLISQIYAAVRTSAIQYATSNIVSTSDPQGEVILFTDKLVVSASVGRHPERTDYPVVTVTAWRRSDLVDVAIAEVDAYPTKAVHYARPWPKWVSITRAYRDRPVIVLPLSRRPSHDAQLTLVDMYGRLIDDLLA